MLRTQMSAEARLELVIRATAENPLRGVPCLIGPTQYGKTFIIRAILARMGIDPENIVTTNPQNDLPEDIAGWPYREGSELRYTQPANVPPHLLADKNYDEKGQPIIPWAMFIDELDKAQESVLSCLLTLFNPDERRLRQTKFRSCVPIISAMNEPDGRVLPDPLLARLLFIPFPPADMALAERQQFASLKPVVRELFPEMPTIRFPARPKAPGSIHKLEHWLDVQEFWSDQGFQEMVVRGLFPEASAAVVLAKLKDRTPAPTKQWAQTVPPTDLPLHLPEILHAATREESKEIFKILVDRANNDATQEISRMLLAFLDDANSVVGIHRDDLIEHSKKAFINASAKARHAVILPDDLSSGAAATMPPVVISDPAAGGR